MENERLKCTVCGAGGAGTKGGVYSCHKCGGKSTMVSAEKKDINDEMQAIAAEIMARFEGLGFMLAVFPFGVPGQSNYISNARPQDMGPILKQAALSIEAAITPVNKTPLNGN